MDSMRDEFCDEKEKPEMKPRHGGAAAISTKPCQRPGCLNLGRMRFQKRKHTTRFLYLCDECLESLLAIHINDLFVKFGETPNKESEFFNSYNIRGPGQIDMQSAKRLPCDCQCCKGACSCPCSKPNCHCECCIRADCHC